jgi:peptidoglycan lytic transglycosylase
MKTARWTSVWIGFLLIVLLAPGVGHGGEGGVRTYARIGDASWYGYEFASRLTANGERFDPRRLTCAHRSLPLGSRVRVTNLLNGRTVLVRINDRGPYVDGREIDLSLAAARALDMVERGVAALLVEPL